MHISPDNNVDNRLFYSDKESSKNGKWIEGVVETDLQWFKSTEEIHFMFDNNNITEEFTISNFSVELEIYYEE